MTAVSVLWGRRAGSRSLWLEDADSLRVGPTCHDINHQVPADHHSPSYGDLCYKQRAHRAQCGPCARRLHYLKCTGSRPFWAKAPWRVRWKLTSTIYAGQDFLGGPAVGKSICQFRGQRFDPWPRKIPHAERCHNYWSLCALEPMLCNKRRHSKDKPLHGNQRVAPSRFN